MDFCNRCVVGLLQRSKGVDKKKGQNTTISNNLRYQSTNSRYQETEISKTRRSQQKNRYQQTKSNTQKLKLSEKTRYQKLEIANSGIYQNIQNIKICVFPRVRFPTVCRCCCPLSKYVFFWCPLSKSVTFLVSTFQMCRASLLWCVGAFSAQALPV